jgi:ATP-dependent DNA helicase DinG
MIETLSLLWWEKGLESNICIHVQTIVDGRAKPAVRFDLAQDDAGDFLKEIGSNPILSFSINQIQIDLEEWCEEDGYLSPVNSFIDIVKTASYVWPTKRFEQFEQVIESIHASGMEDSLVLQENDLSISQPLATPMLKQLYLAFSAVYQTIENWPMLLLQQVAELSTHVDPGLHLITNRILHSSHRLADFEIPKGRQVIHQLLFREVEVPEPLLDDSEFVPSHVIDAFAADGPMTKVFPEYQPRQGQLDMVAQVAKALSEERHAIVEAGTGTGKSLGYLVPAAYFSLATGEKVVVATHTLHLQTQLLERDVPIVKRLLDRPIHFAILKGRTNYVCMRKVASQVNAAGIVADKLELSFLIKTLVWLKDTIAGEKEELPLVGSESDRWGTIQSETETCINKRCPWFKHCYYHRAKAVAQQANIIITNHSLVLTDLKADHSVLPGYSYLVLDEAHQLEDGATKHLGLEVHYFQVFSILSRLAKDAKTGLLPQLKQKLVTALQDRIELSGSFASRIDQLLVTLTNIRQALEEWFSLLSEYIQKRTKLTDDARQIYRVVQEDRTSDMWKPILLAFDNFHSYILDLRKHVKKLESEQENVTDESLVGQIQDAIGVVKELDRIWEQLLTFMQADDTSYVTWLEREERASKPFVGLFMAPIDVGPLLDKQLFSKKRSIILTSATLTVKQRFDHVTQRLGLSRYAETGELTSLIVESPFRYRDQALLCIPTDMPAMVGEGSTELLEELSDTLVKLARVSKGRMLVLFTSYRMLSDVHERTLAAFQEHQIELFAQGVTHTNRHRLIQDFKDHEQAVLFGTNSLWEGVDIPGDKLSTLVIVRLPFWPPNHPVVEARTENLKKQGKNAFTTYAVPQAIVRFKQGFGRLVRSTRDVGAVVVLDRRIVDASYGKTFLHSLPGPRIFQGTRREIYAAIYHWLQDPF